MIECVHSVYKAKCLCESCGCLCQQTCRKRCVARPWHTQTKAVPSAGNLCLLFLLASSYNLTKDGFGGGNSWEIKTSHKKMQSSAKTLKTTTSDKTNINFLCVKLVFITFITFTTLVQRTTKKKFTCFNLNKMYNFCHTFHNGRRHSSPSLRVEQQTEKVNQTVLPLMLY